MFQVSARAEHYSEAADNGIEAPRRIRQIVRKADIELCVAESMLVCRATGGCHHLRDGIYANDLAIGSHHGRYAQGRFAGPGSHIENCMSAANQRVLD